MDKQPYIPFYLGDYIKDTRVLSLSVKGGWVDLILAMWDNVPRGEISGTMEDFSRIMNCSIQEANLVIQTLKQKNIFGYEELEDGLLKIISRKQKKMQKLSETRKNTGKKGGNPVLVNQNETKILKLDKLNHEYEYINRIIQLIENKLVIKIEESEKQYFMHLITEMARIFTNKCPGYFFDKETDYSACLQIAYNIAQMKEWSKHDIVNGKMKEGLESWKKIVEFVKSDEWFSTRSLSDLGTTKEWQRLVQKMGKKPTKPKGDEKTGKDINDIIGKY